MSKPLKIGFIGGALNSAVGTTHVIASQMDRRWRLAAACFSPNDALNRETSDRWGLGAGRSYSDWREFLEAESDKLDAVGILTPTPLHKEMVIESVIRGIPVICEKSLCVSVQEALEVRDAVREHNAYLAVIYNYSGYAMLREMKLRIEAGEIGAVQQVHIEMPQEGYLKHGHGDEVPSPQAWRLEDREVPTLHLDLGVHLDHMVRFLTGATAEEVVAVNSTFGAFRHVVDNTMAIARYSQSIDCRIWFGKSALGHSNGLKVEVFGDGGTMRWVQLDPERLVINDASGVAHVLEPRSSDLRVASSPQYNRFKPGHPTGFLEAFANYYQDLADSVLEFQRGGTDFGPWVFGVDEAIDGLAVLEAMHHSALHHSWQIVDRH